MLQFLHQNQIINEARLPADLTVLDYLRESQSLCGTKEGCASGDCGACTVVIGELVQDAEGNETIRYRSANSCITFVGALHGKQLITVDELTQKTNPPSDTVTGLHPSQRVIVEHHASQCGFCTPGFVMSLFAAMKTAKDVPVSREYINEQLGGNLCRCTGYRPIIDAAEKLLNCGDIVDQFDHNAGDTIQALRGIADNSVEMGSGFFRPVSLDQLYLLKQQHPDAAVLGGGTDLALRVTQQLDSLESVIMLDGVAALSFVTQTSDEIRIGAGTSLTWFRDALVHYCPELDPLLARFAGTQVRNQATVGGNFANASPVGDLPPVFIALNASLVLASARGERTVKAHEFFVSYKETLLQPDEIIREFMIPRAAFDVSLLPSGNNGIRIVNRFYKVSKRIDDDISAVCAAFHLQLSGNTIVAASTGFGGMAAIPKRAQALEATLAGRVLDEQCLLDAAVALTQDFQPIDDVRATAEYRSKVSANLLHRLAAEIYTPDVATTVESHGH